MDDVEQVLAMKELEQLGVSAVAIARRTGAKRKIVDAALTVAGSEATTARMRDQQLTLDDAPLLAEFADDERATDLLLARMQDGRGVEHLAQQIRNERATEAGHAAVRTEISERGLQLIEKAPSYDDKQLVALSQVQVGMDGSYLTAEEALEQAPASVFAHPTTRRGGGGRWEDGQRIAEPDTFEIGYALEWSSLRPNGWWHYSMRNGGNVAAQTPEEQAAVKEERRSSRESMKAWTAATTVRVLWLQELLQRRAMPKVWELLAARQALEETYGYPWSTVLGLLGKERSENGLGKYDVVKYLDEHPAKAAQVALALALGSIEGARDFNRKGWQSLSAKPYLELLASWGYDLSDVERETATTTAAGQS
ncbi:MULTISPECIES: hypothetical protein [unclassified Curtobacterium]|uniref:hypothetical protein n=1 Tax=unclassified Curtobacterium TaxID=257496 RepID=UPI00382880DA